MSRQTRTYYEYLKDHIDRLANARNRCAKRGQFQMARIWDRKRAELQGKLDTTTIEAAAKPYTEARS